MEAICWNKLIALFELYCLCFGNTGNFSLILVISVINIHMYTIIAYIMLLDGIVMSYK